MRQRKTQIKQTNHPKILRRENEGSLVSKHFNIVRDEVILAPEDVTPEIEEAVKAAKDLDPVSSQKPCCIRWGEYSGDEIEQDSEKHNPDFNKVSLLYYAGDDTLVYEFSHTLVAERGKIVGYEWINAFGSEKYGYDEFVDDNESTVFVKNNYYRTYYCIMRVYESYGDVELDNELMRNVYGPMDGDIQ